MYAMNIRLKAFFKNMTTFDTGLRYSRLKGSLTTYKAELEQRIKSGNSIEAPWAIEANKLVDKSEKFLNQYKFDEAWKCFHTAYRQEIFGMNKEERIDASNILISESNKLTNWRKNAIADLLGDPKSKKYKAPAASALVEATRLKDEHYNNLYYQNSLTSSLYRMLFWLLAIVTGLLIWFASRCITGLELPGHDTMVYGVILFGLLGAITSSILFTRNQSASSRISEISTNTFIVLSKIAVGVGFTVFIYFLLRSSFLDSIKLFNFSLTTDIDYYTIAFVSGFTERIAQKALNFFVGDEDKKKN